MKNNKTNRDSDFGAPSNGMELRLNNLKYEDIKIGDIFSFERVVHEGDINQFAALSGDRNPLHLDDVYAKTTKFGGRIAHGMLLGSFFSALVGMLCPGLRCLYLSQNLRFKNPVKLNEEVKIYGKVMSKSDATKILTIETIAKNSEDKIVVEGVAQVQVL